ncbi:hypothetical protein [Spirosoma validum]|uniref:Uncharacterized protein n=1 Tax=Spirosoma validum TaxID=2771355 RepID=A0A927GCQ3_9BACT|nr:hypothetical protein [Spirosoma validum]MBD2752770.1 hypothetical protein [Spirosoma validum]
MKHVSIFLFFLALSLSTRAQEIVSDTNYYTLPSQRRPVLTADPDQRSGYYQLNADQPVGRRRADHQLIDEFKEMQTWYAGAEGGFRSDISTLSNTFNSLVSNPTQTKAVWSILLGYTYRNCWGIETGYSRSPIHLSIKIANGQNPLDFNYQNSGYGIPLRLKRRIGLGSRSANGTGFWLTAGAWFIPNGNGQMDNFRLIGYSSRSRGSRTDTLRLTNSATAPNRLTGLAEVGVEYAVRLSSFLELGAYARTYWGLGTALRSELTYTINSTSETKATMTADGTGWGFGIALRYIYGRQHEAKHLL